jgi:hypothetical protein
VLTNENASLSAAQQIAVLALRGGTDGASADMLTKTGVLLLLLFLCCLGFVLLGGKQASFIFFRPPHFVFQHFICVVH